MNYHQPSLRKIQIINYKHKNIQPLNSDLLSISHPFLPHSINQLDAILTNQLKPSQQFKHRNAYVQRPPILGLERIRQISLQKGYGSVNEKDKEKMIIGNYQINNNKICELKERKMRILSSGSTKLKICLQNSKMVHKDTSQTNLNTMNNSFRQLNDRTNSIKQQVKKSTSKKKKIQVLGSTTSLRRIQYLQPQINYINNQQNQNHTQQNLINQNYQELVIQHSRQSNSPINEFVESEKDQSQAMMIQLNKNVQVIVRKYEEQERQNCNIKSNIPYNSVKQNKIQKEHNIKKITISLKRK